MQQMSPGFACLGAVHAAQMLEENEWSSKYAMQGLLKMSNALRTQEMNR